MKIFNLYLFILSSFLLSISFTACGDDKESIKPSEISNLKAEPQEGAIMLSWDNPSDNTLLYALIEYTNPRNGELVKKNVSSHANSLLIDQLLKRDGQYEFTITPISSTGDKGNSLKVAATSLRRPAIITEYATKIEFTIGDLTANASEPSEGPLDNLIDGNLESYYHTAYNSPVPFPQWVQFKLPEAIEAVKVVSRNRAGHTKNHPNEVEILGSNDGTEWEEMGKIASGAIPDGSNAKYESPAYLIEGKTFKYIRYNVLNGTGNVYFHLAELELYKITFIIDDPDIE